MCSAEMKSVASEASVQEASREDFSPLSTSPAAKMIKIEELPEAPTQTSDQYVLPSFLFHFTDFFIFIPAPSMEVILGTPTCVPCVLSPRVPSEIKQPKRPPQAEVSTHPPLSTCSLIEGELPPPPSSSFQLEAELRKIGNQPEAIYRYLRVSRSLKGCLHADCTRILFILM